MKIARRAALLVAIALVVFGLLSIWHGNHLSNEKAIYDGRCLSEVEAKEAADASHAPTTMPQHQPSTTYDDWAALDYPSKTVVPTANCLKAADASARLREFEYGIGGCGPLALLSGFVIFALGLIEQVLIRCLRSAVATLLFISASATVMCIAAFMFIPRKTFFLAVPATLLAVAAYFFVSAINRFIQGRFQDPQPHDHP